MDKYNRLCANIDGEMNFDCTVIENYNKEYCELLQTIYTDCVRFRDLKMKSILEEKRRDNKKKISA